MGLKFFNLHGHTGASVYDGLGQPKDYANWMLKNAGEDSGGFACTDHGNMNNVGYQVASQKEFDKKDLPVKMAYGVEAYFLPDLAEWRALKEKQKEEKDKKKEEEETTDLVIENEEESKDRKVFDPTNRRNHLVVLAHNQVGLKNLFRLVSRSYREGFYRKPRIDIKMLRDLNEGLLISTACLAGIPSYASFAAEFEVDVMQRFENELGPLMEIFGKDRFFLELQFNRIPMQQTVNSNLIQFAKKTGFHLIAAADSHYPKPEMWKDRELYKLLSWKGVSINEKMNELDTKTIKDLDCELYLKNGDQMFETYEEMFAQHCGDRQLIKEAIERTFHIGHDLIEKVYPTDDIKLPKTFQVTEAIKTAFDQLKTFCLQGLKDKNLAGEKQYVDRTVYELKVIRDLDLAEYFLVQKEILDVLRKRMLTGVGRGSGAGSLVCYLLDITFVDPIKYNLLFERFMSTSRKEIPDVDSDIALKDQALEILGDHFGVDNVLGISNYNRLQVKSLLKDISKLYGVSFEEANSVTTIMETEAKPELMAEVGNDQKLYELTFDGLKRYSPTFQKFLVKYPKIEEHIVNLYHEVKAIGRHAGGVLVVPDAESCLPVIKIRNVQQSPISEGITVKHLKYFGLVKFDVLGLATLRIIERCIEIILKRRGNKKPTVADIWEFYRQNLHPSVIDEADPMVFKKVYQDGNFPSIFQFAEKAVQKFCKSAMPNSVSDLSAITALFRPGPLSSGAHLKFLGAVDKKNIEAFKKEHPILQEVLGETRGVLLYQEEFMLLSHKLAGFTLEEANRLRKLLVQPETSMAEELKRERIEIGQKFIKGCIDKGLTEDRATILWEKEILPWCSYGFNKSHSVSYAFNSYQCAWLYTYYEAEWIKACLERDPNPQETLGVVRSLGYVVEKPDVNKSDVDEWVVDNDKCCVPSLTSLKGVGSTGAQELVRYRPMGGYKSLQDFFYSGDEWRYSKLNKKCLQALLRMDAFRNIPGAVGKDGIFKNHAHLENALFNEGERPSKAKVGVLVKYKNFDLIKDKKTTFEVLALETDSTDWTSVQKIEHQKEIVGFYDKSLIVGKYLPMFREFEIDAIDEADDEKAKKRVWAIVDEITQKVAKTGQKKPFIVVKASGITEKPYTFRVWNTMASKSLYWVPGNVLVFGLQYSDEWGYAVPANAKIIKVER